MAEDTELCSLVNTDLSLPEITSNKMQCTRVKYTVDSKEYEMVFVGTNGVVYYDAVPSSVKMFERTQKEKEYLKKTSYPRHQALAALTAYVLNLSGTDVSRSTQLRLILKHMCLNALERDRMVKFLKQRYTADISEDVMLNRIRCLLTNKKTICYVWQLISQDKKVSHAEQVFFDKLTSRFSIPKGEVNSLKRIAAGYSDLKDKNFVKEYLESPAVYRDPNYRIWNFTILLFTSLTISLIVAAINKPAWIFGLIPSLAVLIPIFVKHNPFVTPKHKGVGNIYTKVYRQAELTETYYKKAMLPLKLWHKIVDIQIILTAKAGLLFDRMRS
jgi:hypothetical protein